MPKTLLTVRNGDYAITVTETGVFVTKGGNTWKVNPHVAHYILFLIFNDRVEEAVRISLAKSYPLPTPITP
jgi:hypothetical protein